MNTQRSLALCLLATLSLTTAAAQAAVHGMGLKPSSLKQPVTRCSVPKALANRCLPVST